MALESTDKEGMIVLGAAGDSDRGGKRGGGVRAGYGGDGGGVGGGEECRGYRGADVAGGLEFC